MRLLDLDPALADPDRAARRLRFRPDGRALAAILGAPDSGRRVVVRFDLGRHAGTVIPEPADDDDPREDAPDPAVSDDLELVAEVLADLEGYDRVRLTDTWAKPPQAVELPSVGEGMAVSAVGFAAGGATLLTAVCGMHEVRLLRWHVEGLFDADDPLDAADDPLELPAGAEASALAESPDGKTLAVGLAVGGVLLFDLTGTRRPLTLPVRRRPLLDVGFSPDGRTLAVRTGGVVSVWDARTGDELTLLRGPEVLTAFAFTPDGAGLLVSDAGGGVSRFAVGGWQRADWHDWGLGPVWSVAVAPDGLTAAAGGDAGRVAVWDV